MAKRKERESDAAVLARLRKELAKPCLAKSVRESATVAKPKTHFEQVPVVVVKKIVTKKPRGEKRAVLKSQGDTNNERKKN